MKPNKLIFLSLSLCLLLIPSCKTNDPAGTYAAWKLQNESYFSNMKDSTGYVLYNIPENQGGGSYYYKITTPGNQASVSPLYNNQVKVNYRGKLINQVVFDQTYSGLMPPMDSISTPGVFYANQLIRGWTLNLMQMKVGETRRIVLPQELGYGATGAGQDIAPYSTTVWEVQLVKVNN